MMADHASRWVYAVVALCERRASFKGAGDVLNNTKELAASLIAAWI